MASFKFKRLAVFDTIETMCSEDEKGYFPLHFHDLFCVSLITKGTETLINTEQDFIVPAGMISVTQKNEVHRNDSLGEDGYSYKTLYVNADILEFYNNRKPVMGLAHVIDDPALFSRLNSIVESSVLEMETWKAAFTGLIAHAENPVQKNQWSSKYYLIDELICLYPDLVTDADWLAGKFCMSKYHFIREFKKAKGVTPQSYIMLHRLGKAKEMLLKRTPLNEIAYLNGFYDTSHFSNSFKKYFGVSPSNYLGK